MPNRTVLDSSAILALIQQEPGAEAVEKVIPHGIVSAVIFAEVAGKLVDRGFSDREIDATLSETHLEILAFDERQAREVAALRRITSRRGLSLADNACLALARTLGLPVMTADKVWSQLDIGVEVRLIR